MKKGNHNTSNDSKSNKYTNAIFEDILNNNIYLNTLYKINNQNDQNNKLINMNFRINKKKIFKNKILNLNIDEMPNKYENNKFNDFSIVVKNSLYDKFKMLPNIKKLQNLTNDQLLKLTISNDENDFINHKQKDNKTNFNEYIFNTIKANSVHLKKKKKPLKEHILKFYNYEKIKKANKTFNNIRQKTLNSNYLDINYKIDIHKSWCNLFKKSISLSKKNLINKYKRALQNTITTEESMNEYKDIAFKKNSNKSLNQKNQINDNNILNKRKGFRKSSIIDRFMFKLVNKDECYEDYVSDGRPIDKYLHFRRQLEKNKKYIEKLLLELRRMSNINVG